MAIIQITKRISDNFADGFRELFRVIELINDCSNEEAISIDFKESVFLNPFLLLGLASLANKEDGRIISFQTTTKNKNFENYLSAIHFHQGVLPETLPPNIDINYFSDYQDKTYIPIINFPATRQGNDTQIRDNFLSIINNLLTKQLELSGKLRTAVMYLIDESVNNIVDHSGNDRGFVFAQYYKDKLFMDICIVDNGIGILEGYIQNGVSTFSSHKDALEAAAVRGLSTKDRPEGSRGYGINTSKRMLVEGLGGKYFLYSGNAFYIKTRGKDEIIELPTNLQWKGTFVALRIPFQVGVNFDPSRYYE